jgi:hypothetical protein
MDIVLRNLRKSASIMRVQLSSAELVDNSR